MRRQVTYLMSGKAHLPYLLVSLYTLRKHWSGDVAVYAWPDRGKNKGSYEIAKRMAEDNRLRIKVIKWDAEYRRRNSQFECKLQVMQTLNCDVGMYLDADTMIRGKIDPVFDAAKSHGFAATQWNDWVTTGKSVSGRIKTLREFPEKINQILVDALLEYKWPSVNGGVWACKPSTPVLPRWYEGTVAARSTFISDEKVLHTMMPLFMPTGQFTVMEGGIYNSSPKFRPELLTDKDIRIWHFHGDSNVRPETVEGVKMDGAKSQKGWEQWWPVYQECLKRNLGWVQEWRGLIDNKWINAIEKVLIP